MIIERADVTDCHAITFYCRAHRLDRPPRLSRARRLDRPLRRYQPPRPEPYVEAPESPERALAYSRVIPRSLLDGGDAPHLILSRIRLGGLV